MTPRDQMPDSPLDPIVERTLRAMTAAPDTPHLRRQVVDVIRASDRPGRPWWAVAATATALILAAWLAYERPVPRGSETTTDRAAGSTIEPAVPPSHAAGPDRARPDDPDPSPDARREATPTDPPGRTGRRPRPATRAAEPVRLSDVAFQVAFLAALEVTDVDVPDVRLTPMAVDALDIPPLDVPPLLPSFGSGDR